MSDERKPYARPLVRAELHCAVMLREGAMVHPGSLAWPLADRRKLDELAAVVLGLTADALRGRRGEQGKR